MSAKELYEPPSVGLGSYRILESLSSKLTDEELSNLRGRMNYALENFPELDDITVTVGYKPESDTWYASADWENDIIFLPAHEECPYATINHELAHLAIKKLCDDGVDVPYTSEEFCSILAVSRMNYERIDEPRIAYLGYPDIPRKQWPNVCQRALDYREEHRNYIQKCKQWLEV